MVALPPPSPRSRLEGPAPVDAASQTASAREDFGAALAALARLYSSAEKRGDPARAERYAAAVDILLSACPGSRDVDCTPSAVPEPAVSPWPTQERTLIGLGVVA